jgi:hypothetical protein
LLLNAISSLSIYVGLELHPCFPIDGGLACSRVPTLVVGWGLGGIQAENDAKPSLSLTRNNKTTSHASFHLPPAAFWTMYNEPA